MITNMVLNWPSMLLSFFVFPILGIVGEALAGAAGGLSNYLGQKGQSREEDVLKFDPMTETMKSLAMSQLAPFYSNAMRGKMPLWLQQLMQSQSQQQRDQSIQNYMRQVGQSGMGESPGMATGLSKLYQSAIPAYMQSLSQQRLAQQGQAVQGMQQWSVAQPTLMQKYIPPKKGALVGAGAMQGVQQGLGKLKMPGANKKTRGSSPPLRMAEPSLEGSNAAQEWLKKQVGGATGLNKYYPQGFNFK